MSEAHDNLKEWYFAPKGRRRARYSLVELRRLAREQTLRPEDVVEHAGSGERHLASELVDDFSAREVEAKPAKAPVKKAQGGRLRGVVIAAVVVLGLFCLGGVGLSGVGLLVWSFWPEGGTGAPTVGGTADVSARRIPWVAGIDAQALQLPTGTSTTLTLDLREGGRGAAPWEAQWTSTCGAVAPLGTGESARFLAPHQPGWCRVEAEFRVIGEPSATHTIDLLTLDPLSGPALEVQ